MFLRNMYPVNEFRHHPVKHGGRRLVCGWWDDRCVYWGNVRLLLVLRDQTRCRPATAKGGEGECVAAGGGGCTGAGDFWRREEHYEGEYQVRM